MNELIENIKSSLDDTNFAEINIEALTVEKYAPYPSVNEIKLQS
jgi:hypothetical protein